MIFEYVQSVLILIAAFLVIVSAVGLVGFSKDTKNVVYARIHVVGIFDIACIIAMIGLGQYLLAGIYFVLAPFTVHAIANAFYKSEDVENNVELSEVEEEIDESNPFIHPKSTVRSLEDNSLNGFSDGNISFSTLDIVEEE